MIVPSDSRKRIFQTLRNRSISSYGLIVSIRPEIWGLLCALILAVHGRTHGSSNLPLRPTKASGRYQSAIEGRSSSRHLVDGLSDGFRLEGNCRS